MNNKLLKIFFSGICGSGVSAIAGFMADKGHTISGSDRSFDINANHPLKKTFQSRGISIIPQDGKSLDDSFDFMVFSTAVEPDRPEVKRAKALGIPIKTRPEYLTEIAGSFKTMAVSGTSGKSTASGLLAFLMERLGLSPNFMGGGRVKQFKTSSNQGNYLSGSSEYLIIEACESDGSIVNYTPEYSIILNLALDHHPVSETAKMFEALVKNTEKKVIVNADDKNLEKINGQNVITFSLQNSSHYKADEITYKQFSTEFSVQQTGFKLSLPGRYNLYNALSCIAILSEIGVSMKAIADMLPDFQGIDRRFSVHLKEGKLLVIDDYAHNPHKILSLMETIRQSREHVCYIFQPHGFGPTRMMKKEYIETFIKYMRETDHLMLLPIFYAGGTASKDISSYDLAYEIGAGGRSVEVVEKRDALLKMLHEYQTYVVFGARDESLSDFAEQIASALRVKKLGSTKERKRESTDVRKSGR
jgi:UDP-N-acetylmuramate--alanine ligase